MRPDCNCPQCWHRFKADTSMVRRVPSLNPGGTSFALHCPDCNTHGPLHPDSRDGAVAFYRKRYGLVNRP